MSLRFVAHGPLPWLMVRGPWSTGPWSASVVHRSVVRGPKVHFHRSVVLESGQDDKMTAECQIVI